MRVGGVFKPNALLGSYLVGDNFFQTHFATPLPVAVLVRTTGSSATGVALTRAVGGYPNLKLQTRVAARSDEKRIDRNVAPIALGHDFEHEPHAQILALRGKLDLLIGQLSASI